MATKAINIVDWVKNKLSKSLDFRIGDHVKIRKFGNASATGVVIQFIDKNNIVVKWPSGRYDNHRIIDLVKMEK